jgi:hypothetical protein
VDGLQCDSHPSRANPSRAWSSHGWMLAPQAAVQRLLIPMHFVLQSKADRWTTRQASPREFVAHDGMSS